MPKHNNKQPRSTERTTETCCQLSHILDNSDGSGYPSCCDCVLVLNANLGINKEVQTVHLALFPYARHSGETESARMDCAKGPRSLGPQYRLTNSQPCTHLHNHPYLLPLQMPGPRTVEELLDTAASITTSCTTGGSWEKQLSPPMPS